MPRTKKIEPKKEEVKQKSEKKKISKDSNIESVTKKQSGSKASTPKSSLTNQKSDSNKNTKSTSKVNLQQKKVEVKIEKENNIKEKAEAEKNIDVLVKVKVENRIDEEKIEKEIFSKKTIPEEKIKQINKETFKNLLIAVMIMILFLSFNMGYLNIEQNILDKDLKFFAITSLVISIILFEKSYKKENTKLCIFGIESLIFGIILLFAPYIYFYASYTLKVFFVIAPLYWGIYYAGKSAIYEARAKKKYIKEHQSDVKEITKKYNKE